VHPAAAARELLLSLPGVEEGPCYGTPGYRVRGKLLARLREDGETLVVKCGDEALEMWLQADPEAFFLTDHYVGYGAVLIRLPAVREDALRDVVVQSWRRVVPKKLLAEYDARVAREPAGPPR
jgi:hypothetical protein